MKKLLTTTAFFICIGLGAIAQKGAHIGLHGLGNTVWILNQNSYGLEEFDYTLKTALGGGLVAGYNFTNQLGFQLELNALNLGQNYESSKGANQVRKYNLNYIGIPVLLKYTGGDGNVKFYGQLGPQFLFLNDANLDYTDTTGSNTITIAAKDRFSPSDIGLNFGIGANISILPQLYVNAGLSFYYGFTDINNGDVTNAPGTYPQTGNWRWPDKSKGKYEPSNNAYGGLDIGLHYLFIKN